MYRLPPITTEDRSPPRGSSVTRYAFALAASAIAGVAAMWLEHLVPDLLPPFLPALAAVIATAAFAGFGPGLLSTILLTFWCGYLVEAGHPSSFSGALLRGSVFFLEGAMICAGSAQLMRAIRKASQSEEWHRSLVETSAEGIWVVDAAGAIAYANPRMAEILGTTLSSILGRPYEDFLFPSDLPIEKVRFSNRKESSRQQYDRRLKREDGSEVWVLACSSLTNVIGGLEPGVLAMMTDINERKQAEQALRRSEARFRSLFDNVLEGVYQSSADGRILAANPMLLRMLGLSSQAEMNDANISTDFYVDPEVRRRCLNRLERDGSFQEVEYDLRRRDGRVITVQENARVVRGEDGRALYYEGTLTDVTENKRIEERLRQAQKMEATGRLAAGIAHDFNNILTVITGYAHLVADALESHHPARQSADNVVRAAEGAAALTQQLMSFSRRQSHGPAVIDMNTVVRGTETEIRDLLGSSIALRLDLSPAAVPVFANRGHIEQILLNMAVRARSTSRVAELRVSTKLAQLDQAWCETHADARAGKWATISVECFPVDGGDGLAAGDQAISPARLGASTTQAIVLQYGGFMLSGEKPGCEDSSIYLPISEELPAAPPLSGAPDTVLLVEDEPLIRELSRDMLERQGFRVLVAASPMEAEQISRSSSFDMLITDVTMPEITGPELARRLRHTRPAMKVLYISGYADQPLHSQEFDSPGVGLLQKPFSADSLGRKIRQMLGRS